MPSLARFLCVMLVLPFAIQAAPLPAGAPRLVGYVAGWEALPRIDAGKITAIHYAFAHIAGGAIVLDQPGAADFLAQLRALKARNPQLKILVSVGGWGADGLSDDWEQSQDPDGELLGVLARALG